MDKKYIDAVGGVWDKNYQRQNTVIWEWWNSPLVVEYVGTLLGLSACTKVADYNEKILRQRFADKIPFGRGISVGCGAGNKEFALIRAGIVEHMTMYDLSAVALEEARAIAEKEGFAHAVDLVREDAFALERGEFDLVLWDNSLHHMPNVYAAMAWSRKRLRRGGVLCMNDFVGASRFQWSRETLAACNEVCAAFGLPEVKAPELTCMLRTDPSEAADSERIKDALFALFPNALYKPMGGVMYHVCLTGRHLAVPNPILARLLRIDARLNDGGMHVYAHATAVKG